MAAEPVLDLQPLREQGDDASAQRLLAHGVELGLVLQAPDQAFEALPEGVVTEVVEAGLAPRVVDQFVVLRHLLPSCKLRQYTDINMAEPSTAGADRGTPPLRQPGAPPAGGRDRERILGAAATLVRGFPTWDWRGLTFRAVAERAGVSERTVYRHFATERELHDAVMRRLEQEAGVSYEGVGLDDLADVAALVFSAAGVVRGVARGRRGPDVRRRGPVATRRAARRGRPAAAVATGWTDVERNMAAGLLDVLWNVPSFERLVVHWGLGADDATGAIAWAIGLVVDAIRAGEPTRGRLSRRFVTSRWERA